ncbi:MAG: GNAT family N-acetyltransferase [Kiritimatiellae bacterium]|jgi:GNAT superfamily N-acetyltransferase|nr:GNAT family N-acetyltransferase [Kiritimatiellia bacterium]NLD89190.1 GNAT family N-acetyltransferase [Lentisphaerota bacterium]HOU21617.1 GNAT family N-acetyltransferase [Kiritimatiellia bacterium]HPC19245.1 GNAT family N-acetyltransferase [Kiritimatiellia bacterium]HQQ61479.1 GNAT family N-acetyltransferase [Kiritimatiellia bacterium]
MNIQIAELSAERLPETAELLTDVFLNLEPMTAALHLSRDFYASYVRAVCDHCFEDHLAVTAIDADTGQVVGVAIGLDDGKYRQTLHVIPPEYRAAMEQMNDFFEELDKPLARIPGKWTYVFYLAVAPTYWRAGISMSMLEHMESLLRDKHYEYLVSETTNPKSEGAFRKQGYTEINRRNFADNPGPFSALPGACTLFVKKLA